jgi:MFS family permease
LKKKRGRRPTEHVSIREDEPHVTAAADARAVSDKAARASDGSKNDPEANRRSARAFLIGAAQAAVLIPALFYLAFGVIDSFALAFTGFIVVLCLLVALGYSVPDKPQPQTPAAAPQTHAAAKGGLLDYVGAFWLAACAFGPFFGWLVTASFVPLTEGNWHWRYAARAVLCVGLPILTALPLFRYARGKYWWVVPLLLPCVTALPVWSGVNTLLDLKEGPVVKQTTGYYNGSHVSFYADAGGRPYRLTMLSHTERSIKIEPSKPGGGKD